MSDRSKKYKNVNSRRFTVFDRYFHIPLPTITKHEAGLPFPLRNLSIKFDTNPSTVFLVIVVKDRQTNAGENIFPRFRGIIIIPAKVRECFHRRRFVCLSDDVEFI